MNNNIGTLHNYGGSIALGNQGSQINQTASGNSIALHQRIHTLIEAVGNIGDTLTPAQKTEAVEKLDSLANQSMRPPEQREESKIKAALECCPDCCRLSATSRKNGRSWNRG